MILLGTPEIPRYCIDRFEASGPADGGAAESTEGVLPWTAVHWADASAGCQAAGKRLCTAAEWELACAGAPCPDVPLDDFAPCLPAEWDLTPTWQEAVAARCHTSLGLDEPRDAPRATGAGDCHGPSGAADMIGNAAEFLDDAEHGLYGGGYPDRQTIRYDCRAVPLVLGRPTDPALDPRPHAGFRCCKAPDVAPQE